MPQKGFTHILLIILLIVSIVISLIIFTKANSKSSVTNTNPSSNLTAKAIQAGKKLSSNQCSGEGVPYKLSVSPMRADDFSYIEPYGLMIGGHVTPIDHQYFSPTIFHSPKDTYEVYAMADSKLVSIENHPTRNRLIFSVSCTLFYYYDLLTSLEPGISDKNLPINVKAGQLIGHIGGQTLDFAVWDTTKPLKGFIVPEHYTAEGWKLYTADPLDYYTDELKAQILSKYVRNVEPVSGKIDYDIDGKIIGNWFEQGKNGFAGESTDPRTEYWKGHLSIVPNAYDPSAFIISVGYLADNEGSPSNQFSILRSAPDPSKIGIESGLVKYELRRWDDLKENGERWDHMSFAKNIKLVNEHSPVEGCVLVQLIEIRKLKFETFLRQSCGGVNGFSPNSRIYER